MLSAWWPVLSLPEKMGVPCSPDLLGVADWTRELFVDGSGTDSSHVLISIQNHEQTDLLYCSPLGEYVAKNYIINAIDFASIFSCIFLK